MTSGVACCSVGNPNFAKHVPKRFVGQLLGQMLVTKTNFSILLKLSETGVLEVVIIHCQKFFLDQARILTSRRFEEIIGWAHKSAQNEDMLVIPPFCSKKTKKEIKHHLGRWLGFNNHIKEFRTTSAH